MPRIILKQNHKGREKEGRCDSSGMSGDEDLSCGSNKTCRWRIGRTTLGEMKAAPMPLWEYPDGIGLYLYYESFFDVKT